MKHLKSFNESNIEKRDFPFDGYDLSIRERRILIDLVGEDYLNKFTIKVDDHYYYSIFGSGFNMFDKFSELKDYILSRYYTQKIKPEELLELLKNTELDPSFDGNWPIKWASSISRYGVEKFGLYKIKVCKEIVKLLLNDDRVRSKLGYDEINIYIMATYS